VGQLGSTCDPQLQMVSRGEYVAVTCMGSDDKTKLMVYSFDGHEAWEEPMGGLVAPVYALAPAAGRFALLRSVSSVTSVGSIGSADLSVPADKQELRVYETESGDMLLKAPCSPVVKTAENFGLADDGSLAAVVRDGAIVVYKLDAPDKHDLADMAQVARLAPPASSGEVTLPRIMEALQAKRVVAEATIADSASAPVASPASATAVLPVPAAVAQAPVAMATERPGPANGDLDPAPGRQPPTLLKPGEKPEFGKKNPEPDLPVDLPPEQSDHN
jgi:hypothetical protein